MKKKNYNPFKMWGSWIGLILGITIFYSFIQDIFDIGYMSTETGSYFFPIIFIAEWIRFSIEGFLIGWGIHSLFRKFKKR